MEIARKTGLLQCGHLTLGLCERRPWRNRRESQTSSGATHALLWTRNGRVVELGTLGGDFSGAFAVNDRGHVGGNAIGKPHAFRWTREEGMVDLGTVSGNESWTFAVERFVDA